MRDEVSVDLPRPRTLDVCATPRFGKYVSHIRGHFDALFQERAKVRRETDAEIQAAR
jgi:hypothetical protein